MPQMGKALLALGLGIAAVGLVLLFWDKLPLNKIPLGRRPGDINIQREGFRFSFPIVTCALISIVVSLLLWLFRK